MSWYYLQGEEQVGPVEEVAFRQLVDSGVVSQQTLVWRTGLAQWQAFGTLTDAAPAQESPAEPSPVFEFSAQSFDAAPAATAAQPAADSFTDTCAECGKTFDIVDMIAYKGMHVCADCKPIFFQRIKEGVQLRSDLVYGGFWIRFLAKIIDGVVLLLLATALGMITGTQTMMPQALSLKTILLGNGLNFVVNLVYNVFFLGKFAATPGKMVCGLKIVRPDGERITYLRARGRTASEFISGLILYVGYIMAAFDGQKRALHDRICDTRVVKK